MTGGPRDLVNHGITGYVINTHRPDELEAVIHHYFREADRNLMAMQARISVEGRTWDEINAQLISHYKAVINENESRIVDEGESGVA
jgi:phosphatidylinositol alpha 1,6-mannosyltransferase